MVETNDNGYHSYLGEQYAVKKASITVAAAGTQTITGAADEAIVVLSYSLLLGASAVLQFQDEDAVALSGAITAGVGGQNCRAEFNPHGHFWTAVGKDLKLAAATAAVAGHLTYITPRAVPS